MDSVTFKEMLHIFVNKVLVWGLVRVLGARCECQATLSLNPVLAVTCCVTWASDFSE